jgi:tetratricopeptide (TPR) repeat protein
VRAARQSVLRGRRPESDALDAAWAGACDGSAALVTIAGAGGIGKTRLLAEIATRADASGGAILFARCDDAIGDPYHSFVQVMRQYAAAVGADTIVSNDARDAAVLATIIPELPIAPAVQCTRSDLFDAIARTIERCAREYPCLLLFDDVHHADRATLQVLRHVLRANADTNVLAVVAFRPHEMPADGPLPAIVGELSRELSVTRLNLAGLDRHDVAELVTDLMGHPYPALALALHREAAGNPLFVSEYVAHMCSEGRIKERGWRRGDIVSEDVGVPPGVHDLLASRMERLTDRARDILVHAAVIGGEFDVHLLAAMCTAPEDEVFACVDEAIAAGLVTESDVIVGRWFFAQPLFRSVLIDDLTHARRSRLHERVVVVLENCGDESPETFDVLAYHSFSARTLPGMAPRAISHTMRAAEDAARVFAWERAVTQYERAVTVMESQPDHDPAAFCDLLLALGDAHIRAMERHNALPVFLQAAELAEEFGWEDRLALAAIGYGYMAKAEVADERALALWDRALKGTTDPALQAMLTAARATHMTFAGHDVEARAASKTALTIARTTSDPRALAVALAGRCITLWGEPAEESRRVLAQELAALGILAGNDEWLLDGVELAGVPLLELGRTAEFDRALDDLAAAGRRTGHASSVAQATQWAAMRALMRGEIDHARELADRVIELAPNAPNFSQGYFAQQYLIERAAGKHHVLLPQLASIAIAHPEVIGWTAAYARGLAEAGQPGDAKLVLDRLLERIEDAPARNWTWVATLMATAETAARLADAHTARVVQPLLHPYAGHFAIVASGVACEGAIDRFLALLAATVGDDETALAYFQTATALEERAGATALLVRTKLDHAALLRRSHRRAGVADARRLEDEVAADCDRLGLVATPAIRW